MEPIPFSSASCGIRVSGDTSSPDRGPVSERANTHFSPAPARKMILCTRARNARSHPSDVGGRSIAWSRPRIWRSPMRVSLVLVLPMVLSLGCAAESSSFIDGSASGGNSGDGGRVGSTGGASGGTAGHATGGTAGHASGGTTGSGGSSGGAAGHATGGTAGHASGGTTGSGGSSGGAAGHATGGTAGHASGGTTGTGGSSGGAAGHASGGTTGTGGTPGTGGTTGTGGGAGQAGNPNGSCKAGVPAKGQPADVSSPTSVIGTGTAASCTFTALNTAVGKGGVITFNCGGGAVTIPITATMNLPTTKNTVIDGGNKITLDGGHAVQILNFNGPDFQANNNGLTLQHIALINGKTTPTQMIPVASQAACSQGYDDGQGGAVFINDGNLLVVDCVFTGNQAAQLGPDTGGGAIYLLGSKNGAVIVGSTFTNNSGANAGAVGALFGELDIYNSLFQNNTATGHDANDVSQSMCSVINNGQYEIGSGGNGGAIYGDGNGFNILLCGDAVLNNAAGKNAFGGGIFFTSDDMSGTLTITDTTITGNTGGSWTNVTTGSVTNVGTAIGVNAKSITVKNSTLQGM